MDIDIEEKIKIALSQKPEGFKAALKIVRDGIGRNAGSIRRLSYEHDRETGAVTVLCEGAIVGVLSQSLFESLFRDV